MRHIELLLLWLSQRVPAPVSLQVMTGSNGDGNRNDNGNSHSDGNSKGTRTLMIRRAAQKLINRQKSASKYFPMH